MTPDEYGRYITVMTERDECQTRVAELERREALLTFGWLAANALLLAQKNAEDAGSDEEWIEEIDAPLVVAAKAFSEAHRNLGEAGFPWPTGSRKEPDSVCPACGETFSADCWRCVGAEDPRS